METNTNNTPQQENNENKKEKKSWFERNLWVIAVFVALFLVRMCGEMSRH